MRAVALSLCLFATAAIPAAALAQQQGATRSVDDYVCAFTEDCDEAAPDEEAAPEATANGPRRSSTRGFSLARPKEESAAPAKKSGTKATAQTGAKARVGGKKSAATASTGSKASAKTASAGTKSKMAATAPRRVDLRLSFELGSATLTSQAMEEARVFAEAIKSDKLADRRFMIEGHTDSIGGRDFNLDLSRRRAEAVKAYLVSLGVPAARLETVGYGFDHPLDGRSARSEENRRVEAVLVS